MAQITPSTASVTPTIGDDWVNKPLNPQKVIQAYKDTAQINVQDATLYPVIGFLIDYDFKVFEAQTLNADNIQTWFYADGDTATRDADFAIVNNAIGEVGGGGGAFGNHPAFPNETVGAPTFFPPAPYVGGQVYYNTSINLMMYYDVSRGRFLSISTITLNCGRTSTTSPGSFFRTAGSVTFILDDRGWFAPAGGVLIAITATRTDVDDAQIEVMSGVSIVDELDYGTNTTASGVFNADVTGGDIVTVRVKPSSNNISDAIIIVVFKQKSP